MKKTIYVIKTLWSEIKEWFSEHWDVIGFFSFFAAVLSLPFLPSHVLMAIFGILATIAILAILILLVAAVFMAIWMFVDKIKRILRVYEEQEGGKQCGHSKRKSGKK